MNTPNSETWQDKANMLKNPFLGQEVAQKIRQDLMLVNTTDLAPEDYQLLMEVLS